MILGLSQTWLPTMISVLRFKYFFTSIFILIGATLWMSYPRYYELSGDAFGTYYKVIVVAPKYAINETSLKQQVTDYISTFDSIFSTYRSDSEIMMLNSAPVRTSLKLSPSLISVIKLSKQLQQQLGPQWDPTIVPVSQTYGFSEIETKTKHEIGLKFLVVVDEFHVIKEANIALDLSSIAKGVAVDHISALVNQYSIKGAYVDIGGEIKTTGKKTKNKPWGIGIQSPSSTKKLAHVVYANNIAIATSGNYLNYRTIEGKKVGHILDPINKSEVQHKLLSVSVIAKKCAVADALATGIFVMGPEKAKRWLENNREVPALLIISEDNEEKSLFMNGFDHFLDLANNSFF